MSIKTRIEKLEEKTKDSVKLAVITLHPNESKADAKARWLKESGHSELPKLVVFLNKHCEV